MSPARVVVAGASGGIGVAVVEALLSNGMDVVGIGRDPDRVGRAQREWRTRFPRRGVDLHCLDLASPESLPAYVRLLEPYEELGGLVVVAGSGSPVDGTVLERHVSAQSRNVVPALVSIAACEDGLRRSPQASIVLISSIAGVEYITCPPEYAAAKASLHAYATHWARTLAPVRVNVVAAGNVDSEASVWRRLRASDPDGLAAMLHRDVALGRLGETSEVAETVRYLLSDDASFVTGSVLRVDGGQARSW